jgi:hypothetical protein
MHLTPSLQSIPVMKTSVCDIVEIAVSEYEKGGPAFRGRGVGIHIVDIEVVPITRCAETWLCKRVLCSVTAARCQILLVKPSHAGIVGQLDGLCTPRLKAMAVLMTKPS